MTLNNVQEKQLHIHWFKPKQSSRQKKLPYHQSQFEEEFDQIVVRNQQRGGTRVRLNARVDVVEYKMVYFGFSKLKNEGLSKEVLWKLKNIGLIQDRIRRP